MYYHIFFEDHTLPPWKLWSNLKYFLEKISIFKGKLKKACVLGRVVKLHTNKI